MHTFYLIKLLVHFQMEVQKERDLPLTATAARPGANPGAWLSIDSSHVDGRDTSTQA